MHRFGAFHYSAVMMSFVAVIDAFSAKLGRFYAPTWLFSAKTGRGTWAWTALAAGVIAYNVSAAGEGEMLSEQADRWIEKHPILVRLAVAAVAAHVANLTPSNVDPIHLFFTTARRLR